MRKADDLKRCENIKATEYAKCWYKHLNKNEINTILDGHKDYMIFRRNHPIKGNKYFIVDDEENYYCLIEFIADEKIQFKNINNEAVNYKGEGYKSFKAYKDNLYKNFFEDAKQCKEEFNEDSEVLYAKFRIITKF